MHLLFACASNGNIYWFIAMTTFEQGRVQKLCKVALSILQQTHIRNYYNHTHLDRAYNVWGVVQHHRCNWMQLLCNFLDLLEQSNSHLNLAYQLLQAQHPLKSASERYFSLILPTSLSLSLELARKQVYTSHIHQHPILISFYFFFLP